MAETPLRDQTICVVGAAGSIGSEITGSLYNAGAQLIVLARKPEKLEELAKSIHKDNRPSIMALPADLSQINTIPQVVASLHSRIQRLDGLVFAAAEFRSLGPLAHSSGQDLAHMLTVNVLAVQQWLYHAEGLLAKASAPRIAFLGCRVGKAKPHWGCYHASKVALEALATAYALETKALDRKVGLFYPGAHRSDLWRQAFPGKEPPSVTRLRRLGPRFLNWYLNLGTG